MAHFTITRLNDGLTETCTSSKMAIATALCMAHRQDEVTDEDFSDSIANEHRNLLDGEMITFKGKNRTTVYVRNHPDGAQSAAIWMRREFGITMARSKAPFQVIPKHTREQASDRQAA